MRIDHRHFLLFFLLVMVTLSSCKQKEEIIRPNILVIMSDNQSWNHLGCYGAPVLKPPILTR